MNRMKKWVMTGLLLFLTTLSGCSLTAGPSADDILAGMARVPESGIIRDGLPTYIIMIETMLSRTPEDPEMLEAAARLYSLYGGYLVDDQTRAKTLTARALEYALNFADKSIPGMGLARSTSFVDFESLVNTAGAGEVKTLFFLGSVWLDWIRVRKDDLDAVADLPMIELLMQRVTNLDPDYQSGMATLYLALLASMQYDDQARDYFVLAGEQAAGKHLLAEYFFGVWQVENGEAEDGCARLYDILDNRRKGVAEFALYDDFIRKKLAGEYEGFVRQGKCPLLERNKENKP